MENEIKENKIACPLCGSGQTAFFLHKNKCDVYSCNLCQSRFVYPVPDSSSVYSEDYFSGASNGFGYTNYDADKQAMVPVFEGYMKHIIALRPGRGALFDIGAATGFFLAIAARFGFSVSGVEISAYAADAARKKGIDVTTGTLVDLPKESGPYDVVTMLDVIEHLSDPCAELARVHAFLKPGGILIINTPDAGSLYARLLGSHWHLFVPPEHLVYFNRHSMRTALEQTGYRVISISTVGKKFTLPYIFKTLYMWQHLSLWKWLSEHTQGTWIRHIALPLNLFDNMFVVAEKKEI